MTPLQMEICVLPFRQKGREMKILPESAVSHLLSAQIILMSSDIFGGFIF